MKSEPSVFAIDDLARAPKATTTWEGVRNYQARNLLRDEVKVGDLVLYYHSNAGEGTGVAGVAIVAREGHPDPAQFDKKSEYYDAGATRDTPRWTTVELRFVLKFAAPVTLEMLRAEPALAGMDVLRRGNRLSVQRVRPEEFDVVCAMATAPSRPETAGRKTASS